jgi:hypothetical protein
MIVYFGLGVGSTYSGTAGTWAGANYNSATGAISVVGTAGATFYITGVQLEVGSSATGYEYVNYQTSLANCQRYFIKYGPNLYANGFANQSTNTISLFYLQVPMRAIPTLGTTGTASNYAIRTFDSAGPYLTCNSVPTLSDYSNSYNFTQMRVGANVASGLTAGNAIMLYDNSGTSYLSFSAEL